MLANLRDQWPRKVNPTTIEISMKLKCRHFYYRLVTAVLERLERDGTRVDEQILEAVDSEGDTLLLSAYRRDFDISTIEKLIEKGASIEAPNGKTGETCLHLISSTYDIGKMSHSIEWIKKHKSTIFLNDMVNRQDNMGDTPLHKCCQLRRGVEQMLEILIENGADPGLPNNDGKTPMQIKPKYFNGRFDGSQREKGPPGITANGQSDGCNSCSVM